MAPGARRPMHPTRTFPSGTGEVREDRALLRDRDLVADRDDLGLGIGQELLRAG